uniref:Uncharacterized protein n=1 Tax=Acrobeloides nanus TaxID=290746 RepID=A0A914CMB7_9BILA
MICGGSLLIFCLVTSSTFQTAVASESDSRSVEGIKIIFGGSVLIYKEKPRLKETTTRGPTNQTTTTTTQGPISQETTTTTQGPTNQATTTTTQKPTNQTAITTTQRPTNQTAITTTQGPDTDYCRSKCPISSIKFRQGETLYSTPLHTQAYLQLSGLCIVLSRCSRRTPNNTIIPSFTLTYNNNTMTAANGFSLGHIICKPDRGYWQFENTKNVTEVGCVEGAYSPQAYVPPNVLPPVPANPTCQQCSDSQLVLPADNGTEDQNASGWLYPLYSVYNNLTDGCLTLRAHCEDNSLAWNKRYNPPQWTSLFGPNSAQLLFNYGTVQVPAENGVTHVDLKCKNGQWIYNNGGVDTQVNQIKCRFFNATSTSG